MKYSVIASTAEQTASAYRVRVRTYIANFIKTERREQLIRSATVKIMSAYLQIKDLHKTFYPHGQPLKVLDGIDLDVEKGEIFGIIGFSGAGKSTLARCINRLEKADSGTIELGGTDILSLSKDQLLKQRHKMGMIFQNFNLFDSMTVYQNIAYPLEISGVPPKEIKQRVLETAELVGLTEKLKAHPGALSGGQKQRVGIARAIVTKPDFIISDEATSALDPQTTIQILDLLKEINQKYGITILMITHELDAIRYTCNRMAVLEGGKITESGLVRDIFENPHSKTGELFAKVFMLFQSPEFTKGEGI